MSGEAVFNAAAMEQIRAENEAAMNNQATTMEATRAAYESQASSLEAEASNLDTQAAAQDVIAATAMKTEYYTDEKGRKRSRQVPDMEKRAAARAKAASLRSQATTKRNQASGLRRQAAAIGAEVRKLRQTIAQTNTYIRRLIEIVQQTDLSNAQKLEQIASETEAFTAKVQAMKDSFNDSFPLSSSTLSAIEKGYQTAGAMGALVAETLAGMPESCATGGDPVNLSTGNFICAKQDLEIPGRFPLEIKRFYNGIGGQDGVLGANWTHNYNIQLKDQEEYIRITLGDGHVETYQKVEEGVYVAPLEHSNGLAKTENGYVLVLPTMEQYVFDRDGKLESIADLNGNVTEFTYTDGLLSKVANACGSLSLTYDEEGYLKAVTDHTGRRVQYEYAGNRLVRAEHPTGAVYRYEYDESGALRGLVNALGIRTIENEYDENGRTVKQRFADGGVYELSYEDERRVTTVTEQNGNRVQYERDAKYRTVRTVYGDSEERYEYNANSKRTLHADRNGNVRRYEYDLRGNLTKATDPLGNVSELEYNVHNRPVRITNPAGGVVAFTYDGNGNLTCMIDPIDREMRFGYDERGLNTEYMLPDGSRNELQYDKRGNIVQLTDANGNRTTYEYDGLNRVVKATDPEGHETRFGYNSKGDIARVTNAEGKTREYEYNALGKLTKVKDFDGGETTYGYNSVGKLETVTNQSGGVTRLAYDLMWNITGVSDPLGNEQRYEYNKLGRLVKTIDPEGNITEYEHDRNGNVTAVITPLGARTEIEYDALDRQVEIREADGAVTRYTYDVMGNPVRVTDTQGGEVVRRYDKAGQLLSQTDALGQTTTYTYSALGQVESITDAMGGKQVFRYYPGGKLESVTRQDGESERYEYDRNGNIIRVINALGAQTQIVYDKLDRVTEIVNPLGHSKRFGYDALGNITSITDEKGGVTKYEYSATGELIGVTDALGHRTRYGYDGAGRLTRVEQARLLDETLGELAQLEEQVTVYHRNRRGEVTEVRSPLGAVVRYGYDGMGQLTSKVDEDGLETLYEYNVAGKLQKILYADGKTVELSYNPLRQLTEMRDWLGKTTIDVDALGRARKVTDYEGKTVGYEWDKAGRREKTVYPDGSEVQYKYGASGQLEQVLSEAGVTEYRYDAMGRIRERVMPGEIVTQYKVDSLGRLESLTHSKGTEVLDRFRYSYDPAGNITEIDKNRTGVEADSGLFQYAYDPLGRLIGAMHNGMEKRYAYDSLGNRVMSVQNGVETKHSYNARNQLIRTQEGEAVSEYRYDGRGNLTELLVNGSTAAQYVFDATNRMVSALTEKGKAQYAYNGFLGRVKKLEEFGVGAELPDPCREVRYTLDMTLPYDNLLAVDGDVEQKFIWGNGLIAAEGETSFAYLQDHLGSPVRLVGEQHDTALAYDEFGVPLIDAAQDANGMHNPFGFTGYQADNITGLYYAQARFYSPVNARFVSEDLHWGAGNRIYGDLPVELPNVAAMPQIPCIIQSGNLYSYAMDCPMVFTDPSGEILRWPGEVHSWVSQRIVSQNGGRLSAERWMMYQNPQLGQVPGRVDLVDLTTGKIWEIKPALWPRDLATSQLQNYESGTFMGKDVQHLDPKIYNGVPEIDKYKLSDQFTKTRQTFAGRTDYYVKYEYTGKGIISYSYTEKFTPNQVTADVMGIGIVILGIFMLMSGNPSMLQQGISCFG